MKIMHYIEKIIINFEALKKKTCGKFSKVYDLKKCQALLYIVCSCHVTYAFQSESTLYSCLNVKELLARSRREI